MQKRSRRPQGIGARKISISTTAADLDVVVALAKRKHRGNVSAVFHEMVETLRRQQALDELIEWTGADRVRDREVQALRDEIAAAPLPRRRRRPAA